MCGSNENSNWAMNKHQFHWGNNFSKVIFALVLLLLSGALAFAGNNDQRLTATIIGSGSPIFNPERASASVLISKGGTHILVDMGNGTVANLYKINIDTRDMTALVFTHHHIDHDAEFAPLLIRSLMGRQKFQIIGPPNTVKFTTTYLDLYAEDIEYRLNKTGRTLAERRKAMSVRDIKGGESFDIDGIHITTVKVPHTIYTIAYRFDYNGESIVISGDLTYTPSLTPLARDADYLIIDSGGMIFNNAGDVHNNAGNREPQNRNKETRHNGKKVHAHLNLPESSLIAKQANVKNLVYTHFRAGEIDREASLREIRKNYSRNVIFGEDLMVVNDVKSNPPSDSLKTQTSYPVVDTGQEKFYGNNGEIRKPAPGDDFYGQDASFTINKPFYTDNKDGTITDNVTGLMWQKDMGAKMSFKEVQDKAKSFRLAGYDDWHIPTIKELYSLIQFNGRVMGIKAIVPFIDTRYFNQPLGNTDIGEREIDAQTWSATEYVGKTMRNDETIFGVNFIDGRIKGYPKYNPRTHQPNKMYFRFVRGNKTYGKNNFKDNGDGTITDLATGLTWQQSDSKKGMDWREALAYANKLKLGGYDNWRLPNAKELQSIVDYTRSPETSNSPAINPVFKTTEIVNEAGQKDYPYFWTSTTHLDGPIPEANAAYIAFGRALGKMHGQYMDVHGAGSQRSDPKTGYPTCRGPQGDLIRVKNYVRAVRGGANHVSSNQHQISKKNNYDTEKMIKQHKKSKQMDSKSAFALRFMERKDTNGDGKITLSEFNGHETRFRNLDTNHDGYITQDEAPERPPK